MSSLLDCERPRVRIADGTHSFCPLVFFLRRGCPNMSASWDFRCFSFLFGISSESRNSTFHKANFELPRVHPGGIYRNLGIPFCTVSTLNLLHLLTLKTNNILFKFSLVLIKVPALSIMPRLKVERSRTYLSLSNVDISLGRRPSLSFLLKPHPELRYWWSCGKSSTVSIK